MSEKRFEKWNDYSCKVKDNQENTLLDWEDVVKKLNEQQDTINDLNGELEESSAFIIEQRKEIQTLKEDNEQLKKECKIAVDEMVTDYKKLEKENEQLKGENERLRLELETHKHSLWSTREAERKLSEVTDNLADEVKKNGLLNEEINQLRIENMRLKKKSGDGDMTPNDDFIKGLEQLRKGLDSFKQNLEVVVEQCNETLKRLKEEYDE